MGQQHRKVVKRRRRADYLERQKVKAAAKVVSKPRKAPAKKAAPAPAPAPAAA